MVARERYARVLRAPHARAFLLSEIPVRLPIGINGLAIVLFMHAHADSYAAAGAVAAGFGAALGLTSPVIARLVDRRGLRRVVVPLGILHALAMVGLVLAGLGGAPVVVCAALAMAAGGLLPPLGSITRSLWPRILGDEADDLMGTALAMEGVLIELIFVAGPLLVAAIAAFANPAAALLLSAALFVSGLALYLVQPPVRAWTVSAHAGSHGLFGALRSPGIRTLALVVVPMGFCFGAIEVTVPAFSEDMGSRELSGLLIALWSVGSAIGGLAYGARAWSGPVGRRYARLAAVLPLGYLPLAAAPSVAVMAGLVVLAGVCIAPTLTAGNQIAGDVAPLGAETEAYTWPVMALVVGISIGNWSAGAIVEASGWRTACLAAAGGATLAALLAGTRWRTLDHRPASRVAVAPVAADGATAGALGACVTTPGGTAAAPERGTDG
ncbi:MAG TPA: MFS transporter [Baekduia sp.]|nr:MFS transporter [Baekduia sp.]